MTRWKQEQFENNYPKLKRVSAKIYRFLLKKSCVFGVFWELFLTVVVLMSSLKNKNSLRTIDLSHAA